MEDPSKIESSTLPFEQHKLNLGFLGFLDLIVLSSYQSWAPQCSHTCVGGPKFIASIKFPTKKIEGSFFGNLIFEVGIED